MTARPPVPGKETLSRATQNQVRRRVEGERIRRLGDDHFYPRTSRLTVDLPQDAEQVGRGVGGTQSRSPVAAHANVGVRVGDVLI